jgi:RNA polymerase sigma-70 factor, ECF subfamily
MNWSGNKSGAIRHYKVRMPAAHIMEAWMAKPFWAAGQSDEARAQVREDDFAAQALPHMDDLFRIALRMTRDRARAEDAVQETFLQAWKSFDKFEPGTNCKAWLFRILFYSVHHQRRKWFRFPVAGDSEEILMSSASAAEPVSENLTDEQIQGALDELPPDYRSVALLVDVEEFAYREAAQILGIPIGTVMSRLSRARGMLREKLADTARLYGVLRDAQKEGVQ